MRLSLLRSPIAPDPEADQGHHHFCYALVPHAGGPQNSGVIEEGYRLNMPVLAFPTPSQPSSHAYFSVDNPAFIIDTVKKAEDSSEVVVRLYEARGSRGTATLQTSLPVHSIERVNLLETNLNNGSDRVQKDGIQFQFRPFEIISFKISAG